MKTRRKRVVRGRRWIVLLLIGALLIAADHQFDPIVSASVSQQAEKQTGEMVSKAVRQWLDESPPDDTLLTVERDDTGAVRAMQADTAQISRMQAELTLRIQQQLDGVAVRIGVPVGTLLHSNLLRELGPRIYVRFAFASAAECRLDTRFESAGINQTVFEVWLIAQTVIRPLTAERWEPIRTEVSFCVVQMVIAGAVPNVNLSA